MFKNHPKGLTALFFTEMWERLAFYMLVGILVLYASDSEGGGLGLTLDEANAINGTYLAFVYFTPFLGGMIADRVLGYRRAVLVGGIIFATGLFLLGIRGMPFFFSGLCCLCIGNGLFKPNISAMVGNLYERGDPKRDVGFNIFYMGINIGAAVANLAAAPIRNQISWQWAFWAAAIGMVIGLVVLLSNWKGLAVADRTPVRTPEDTSTGEIFGKILMPAAVAGGAGYFLARGFLPAKFPLAPGTIGFLLAMVPVFAFFFRLPRQAKVEETAGLRALLPVYLAGGTFFMILHLNSSALTVWAKDQTDREVAGVPDFWRQDALPSYFPKADPRVPRPDPGTLVEVDDVTAKQFGTKQFDQSHYEQVAARNDVTAVVLWPRTPAQGEPPAAARKSLSTFVYPDSEVITTITVKEDGGRDIDVKLTPGAHAIRRVVFLKGIGAQQVPVFLATAGTIKAVGRKAGAARLPPGEHLRIVSPEIYQAWNPIWVVVLTPLIVAFFAARSRQGRPVSTPRKLFYGMVFTALSMVVMSIAGWLTNGGEDKVAGAWLVATYCVVTIGELCLSPMGLSLVTKLSPKRLVGLTMGGWFCATAFGNKLSGFLAEIQDDVKPFTFFAILVGAASFVAFLLWRLVPKLEATMAQYKA